MPAYERFFNERYERCLDLYLAPRQRRMRVLFIFFPYLAFFWKLAVLSPTIRIKFFNIIAIFMNIVDA